MDGGSLGVDLVYSDDEISSYSNIFDNAITDVDEEDEARLIETLKAISEGENLEDYINVDEVLRYAAVNVFLVNLDSYFSNMQILFLYNIHSHKGKPAHRCSFFSAATAVLSCQRSRLKLSVWTKAGICRTPGGPICRLAVSCINILIAAFYNSQTFFSSGGPMTAVQL